MARLMIYETVPETNRSANAITGIVSIPKNHRSPARRLPDK
jgi:hypothetical protein